MIDHRSGNPDVTGPIALDSPMPSLTGASLNGKPMTSDGFRGHVTVINAWATWCGPCRHDQPILAQLARRYGSRVRFVGIDYRDDRAQALHFWNDEFGVPYPSYFDPSGKFAAPLRFPFLPVIYVVDAGGTIRRKLLGRSTGRRSRMRSIRCWRVLRARLPQRRTREAGNSASTATAANSAARYQIENLNRPHERAGSPSLHSRSAR